MEDSFDDNVAIDALIDWMAHDGNFAVEEMPAQQLRLKTLRENPQLPGSKSDHVPLVSVTPLASVAADSETEPEGVDAVELEADRKLRAQDRIVFETVPQVGTCRLASSPKCSRVGPKVRTPAVERGEVRTYLKLVCSKGAIHVLGSSVGVAQCGWKFGACKFETVLLLDPEATKCNKCFGTASARA